jgi:small subunit ribosomal protein S19
MRRKRSLWKYSYVHKDLFQSYFLKDEKFLMKTQSRRSTILPLFINLDLGVHDGFSFFKVHLDNSMVGHKLGEFVRTRQPFRYGKK